MEVARRGALSRASKQSGEGQKGKLSCLAASISAEQGCANQAHSRWQCCSAQGHAGGQAKEIAVGAQARCKSWLASPLKVLSSHSMLPVTETWSSSKGVVCSACLHCFQVSCGCRSARKVPAAPRPQRLVQKVPSCSHAMREA